MINEKELKPTVTVMGLHGFALTHPGADFIRDFATVTENLLAVYSLQATFVAAEGSGYTGQLTKVAGRTHRRLVSTSFRDTNVLSFVVNPPGSDEPSFDSFFSVALGYIPELREVTLSFVANESVVPFGVEHVMRILTAYADLFAWYAGYSFPDRFERQPELFVVGLDSGKLSARELAGLQAWYMSPVEKRMGRLRDVFPINLLGAQLDEELEQGVTLRSWIQRDPGSRFEPVGNRGLFLWAVPDARLAELRAMLHRAGMSVT